MFSKFSSPPQTINDFFGDPTPQYLPVSQIAFGPNQVVLPHELPPSSMVFSNPTFNRMVNIPGQNAQTIYNFNRTGRMSV